MSLMATSLYAQNGFTLKDNPSQKKVEVRYDGKLLTASNTETGFLVKNF